MRFLLDQNVPPDVALFLERDQDSAVHVKEVGYSASADAAIMRLALERGEVIVTCDNDFPEMLAHSRARGPSVILLREGAPNRPREIAVLLSSLPEESVLALKGGAVVAIDGRRTRIRRLPIG